MRSSLTPRWTARTPGMHPRFDRLRFRSADPGAATPGPAPAADPSTPSGDPAPAAPAADPAAPVEQTAQPPAAAPATWDGRVESLPEGAQNLIRQLRTENAGARVRANEATEAQRAALRTVAESLGLELPPDDSTAPDPAALAQQVETERARARQAQIELAVFRAAGPAGADPAALLDSRAFLTAVDALDPSAASFSQDVTAAITKAVADNAKLKADAPAAPAPSSVDLAGGTGGQTPRTPRSLSDAIGGAYGVPPGGSHSGGRLAPSQRR